MQGISFFVNPLSQCLPFWAGAGLVQDLKPAAVPPPQVAEQAVDVVVHKLQKPCTWIELVNVLVLENSI